MKKVVCFFIVLFVFIFMPWQPSALASDEESIARETGADSLSYAEELEKDEKSGDTEINIFNKIFAIIKKSVTGIFKTAMLAFYTILCVVVLCSIFSTIKQTSPNTSLSSALDFISLLALSGTIFYSLKSVFTYAADAIGRIHTFMTALLPVTASLYTMAGNVTSGAASSSALILFLTVIESISAYLLFPLLEVGFAISLAGSLPGSINLQSLTTLVKNSLNTILAFIFTMFGVVMYFQTSISAATDNYIYRSVKFASGVFVPVIGSMVGDAARTVMASVETVKSTVGVMGVITILSLVLPPIIYTLMYKAVVLVNAIIARMLGCERESRLLYDINSVLSVLMSLLIGIGVIFIIAIAIFIKSGVSA